MAFGKNFVELIGRLGRDADVHDLTDGGRVANLSVATDEGYFSKQTGKWVDRVEWHRAVTFQEGLIERLEAQATKGRLVLVEGKLQTRRYRKEGETTDRTSTEVVVVPGHRVQFLDKPNGANASGSGEHSANGSARPAGSTEAQGDDFDDDIPF